MAYEDKELKSVQRKMFSRVISTSYCYDIKEVISFLLIATIRTVQWNNASWSFLNKETSLGKFQNLLVILKVWDIPIIALRQEDSSLAQQTTKYLSPIRRWTFKCSLYGVQVLRHCRLNLFFSLVPINEPQSRLTAYCLSVFFFKCFRCDLFSGENNLIFCILAQC